MKVSKLGYRKVRTLLIELDSFGENVLHSPQETRYQTIRSFIDRASRDEIEPFLTCATLKRKLLTDLRMKVSRGYISRVLRELGFKYVDTKKKFGVPKKYSQASNPLDSRATGVFRAVTAHLKDPSIDLMFLDEVIFTLRSTPRYQWLPRGSIPQERNFMRDYKIVCIVLCSMYQLVAIQMFESEVKQDDFIYFLSMVTTRLQIDQIYSPIIVLDRASWHAGRKVLNCGLQDLLMFNQPGKPFYNYIELVFSKVKYRFKERPMEQTQLGEAQRILGCFNQLTSKDFAGFRRLYLRTVKKGMETLLSNSEPFP